MEHAESTLGRAARRRQAQRRTRIRVLGLVTALALGASATWWVTRDGEHPARAASTTTSTSSTTTSTTVAAYQPATVATTKVPELVAFEEPDASASPVTTLAERTEYGLPRTLLVIEQRPGWLHALLPIRPNGATGWVRESDVTLGSSALEVRISLGAHHLVLLENGVPVLEAPVGIGRSQTPTPPGRFYVTDPIDLTSRPNGAYGAYALGISGYSEVLLSFQGGPGQLAVHGTANPSDLGADISNGCVRVANDVILEIAKRVPLGTPVTIEA
jgi:lipoprotein-anchoring transpeptidase ErfK/SrfK